MNDMNIVKFLGQQNLGLVPNEAKSQIYDVASCYMEMEKVGFSELLRYGTDIFILGVLYGKGEMNNELSELL